MLIVSSALSQLVGVGQWLDENRQLSVKRWRRTLMSVSVARLPLRPMCTSDILDLAGFTHWKSICDNTLFRFQYWAKLTVAFEHYTVKTWVISRTTCLNTPYLYVSPYILLNCSNIALYNLLKSLPVYKHVLVIVSYYVFLLIYSEKKLTPIHIQTSNVSSA